MVGVEEEEEEEEPVVPAGVSGWCRPTTRRRRKRPTTGRWWKVPPCASWFSCGDQGFFHCWLLAVPQAHWITVAPSAVLAAFTSTHRLLKRDLMRK